MSRYFVLHNAVRKTPMPSLGLGTYMLKGKEGRKAVDCALFYGYRHLDTAARYGNEADVGEAVSARIRSGFIERKDLFITTKVPSVYMEREQVRPCLEASLEALKTSYVDMLLIHHPWGMKYTKELKDGEFLPVLADTEGEVANYDINETWQAMEELVDCGKVGAIGLSNFPVRLMEQIWQRARIKPANLQCECHVYLQQPGLLQYCNSRNIVITAYAPFGAPQYPRRRPNLALPLEDETVKNIAEKHSQTAGQVLLRHILQRNIVPIPKSSSEQRMKENLGVYDFELNENDMKELGKLDRQLKLFTFDWAKQHPLYKEGEEF